MNPLTQKQLHDLRELDAARVTSEDKGLYPELTKVKPKLAKVFKANAKKYYVYVLTEAGRDALRAHEGVEA